MRRALCLLPSIGTSTRWKHSGWCSSTSPSAHFATCCAAPERASSTPAGSSNPPSTSWWPGVHDRREHWRFIARERNSGVTVLRYAIRTEIRLITSELAIDLTRFPGLNSWSAEDLNILSSLFVNSMIVIAEAIEDAADANALDEIRHVAVKQLRLIIVGISGWHSTP